MKKNKLLKSSEYEDINRERRLRRRENYILQTEQRRQYRLDRLKKDAAHAVVFREILKNEHQNRKIPDKKSGSEKFISAFSFILWTPFDKRDQIPEGYKSRSFNESRQYIDFLKTFIYPYPIPHPLIFTAIEAENITNDQGRTVPSPYKDIIILSKKWIKDIVNGDSFYRKNKEYFTKASAHYFLNTNFPYVNPDSVLELYFYANCKARSMDEKKSKVIAKMFTLKFGKYFTHEIVIGFLDLLGRDHKYPIEASGLGDICDFVYTKITEHCRKKERISPFSFRGRTMTSIVCLTNEWHADMQRERGVLNGIAAVDRRREPNNRIERIPVVQRWNGIRVSQSRFEYDDCVWTVKQILTAQDLLNEGRKMKNCVASYTSYCASGEGSIFNVSYTPFATQITESKATLQITRNLVVVQAKAKCNMRVLPTTMKVIKRWAQANGIKIDEKIL